MTATPLVTVLMTAYNRERYIAAAIEGVLAQTLADFELIVVDDCSSDRTVEIARRYLSDSRVQVIENVTNLGDYPNRNRALTLATGTFVKFHDSDDVIYPFALATLCGYLEAAPEAGFALSGIWPGGPCPMLLTPRMAYEREFLGTGMFNGGPSNALFRTEVIRKLGGFPLVGVASDYAFWLQACTVVNVLLVPGDLQWYRIHSGQEIQSSRAMLDQAEARKSAWKMLSSASCPLDPADLPVARANFIYTLVRQAWWDLRAGHVDRARQVLFRSGIPPAAWAAILQRRRRDPLEGTPLNEAGEPRIPDWEAVGRSLKPDAFTQRHE